MTSANPTGNLPYVPGLPPPFLDPTPAVGFSASSVTAQTAGASSNGLASRYEIGGQPVEIINTTISGTAVIQLLGGAPCWIGFSASVTPDNGYRLVIDDPVTVQPVVQVWAIGLTDSDVPNTTVQVVQVEAQ